jgi:hypothetical protein
VGAELFHADSRTGGRAEQFLQIFKRLERLKHIWEVLFAKRRSKFTNKLCTRNYTDILNNFLCRGEI